MERKTAPAAPAPQRLCRPGGPAVLLDAPKLPGGRQNAGTRLWGRNRPIPGGAQEGPARHIGAAGRTGRGNSPGALRAGLTAPQPPGRAKHYREGRKTPVRASGSKIEISKPQGPPREKQCVNPGLNPGPPAEPDPAGASRDQPGAMNAGGEEDNQGRERRLPRPRPALCRKSAGGRLPAQADRPDMGKNPP